MDSGRPLPRNNGDGELIALLVVVILATYLWYAYTNKKWPFKPKKGDECEVDSDDEDENADEYEYDSDPDTDDEDALICTVKECKDGWLVSDGACVAEGADTDEDTDEEDDEEDESNTCPYGQFAFYSDPVHCTDVTKLNIELGSRSDSGSKNDLNFGDYFYAAGETPDGVESLADTDVMNFAKRFGFHGAIEYKYEKKWWVGKNGTGKLVIQEGSAMGLSDTEQSEGFRSDMFTLAPIYQNLTSNNHHIKNETRVLIVAVPSKRVLKNESGALALSDVVYDGTAKPDIDDACKFVITEPTTNDLFFKNGTSSFEFRNVRLETDYVSTFVTRPVPSGYARPIDGNMTFTGGAGYTLETIKSFLNDADTDPTVDYGSMAVPSGSEANSGVVLGTDGVIRLYNIDGDPFDRESGIQECARLCDAVTAASENDALPSNPDACTGFTINHNSTGGACNLMSGSSIESVRIGYDNNHSALGLMGYKKVTS